MYEDDEIETIENSDVIACDFAKFYAIFTVSLLVVIFGGAYLLGVH